MSALTAWAELLDRFEADLDAPSGAPWHPVALPAPLPFPLVARARRILALQEARMNGVRGELEATRAHLAAISLVPPVRSDAAAYVDRDA